MSRPPPTRYWAFSSYCPYWGRQLRLEPPSFQQRFPFFGARTTLSVNALHACRIRFYTQDIVVFREDLLHKMRRACVVPPSEKETSDPFQQVRSFSEPPVLLLSDSCQARKRELWERGLRSQGPACSRFRVGTPIFSKEEKQARLVLPGGSKAATYGPVGQVRRFCTEATDLK